MPEVIVIDEIGTELEALAARTIAQRGVQMVATAHGNFLEDLIKNPSLTDLVGGKWKGRAGNPYLGASRAAAAAARPWAPPSFGGR